MNHQGGPLFQFQCYAEEEEEKRPLSLSSCMVKLGVNLGKLKSLYILTGADVKSKIIRK